MANNHDQFIDFNDIIDSNKRSMLKRNRDALRNRIRNYYKREYPEDIQPKFNQQGSYAMFTILNPISGEDLGAYDLDDGVYFVGNSISDRLDIMEYHKRIYSAVDGHTSQNPEDKDPCVTVVYADGHHIDLPIYFMIDGHDHPMLANKKGWLNSDPRDFYKWFNGKKEHPQLRRIVRYLKAWRDYVDSQYDRVKMPNGCILTIWAVEYYRPNDRDDCAMKDLLNAMYDTLSTDSGFHCYRPTYPIGEDLVEKYSSLRKDHFLKELKSFKEDTERAINNHNQKDSCEKWQKHFGNRFCCSTAKDEDDDARQKSFSGSIKNDSQFA